MRTFIKNILAALLFTVPAIAVKAQGFNQQDVIKVTNIKTDDDAAVLTIAGKQTTRSYYDGFGRPLQTVGLKASPLKKDIIQPMKYDTLGRPIAAWLPYAGASADTMGFYHNSPFTEQAAFYRNTSQYLIATDSMAYSQQVFENSPLQRLLAAGMTGKGFQPAGAPLSGGSGTQHYKTISYRSNNSGDATILRWNPNGSYQSAGYSYNVLAVTDGTDEDNVETLTYTDANGHTILKRQVNGGSNLDTYYVYNEAGMINYLIPPKAVTLMVAASNYSLTQTAIAPLLFHYTYNTQGQVVTKKVPGKGPMSIIYDPLNRPVLMQDNLLAAAYKWNYIKYDVKGRAISQGIYVDASHYTPTDMQTAVTAISGYATAWYESRSTSASTTGYYTNNIFPTSSITPLAYSYYDDYSLDGSTTYAYHTTGLPGEVGPTDAPVTGMPTMTLKSTVGSGMTAKWLLAVQFYDHNLRLIQSQSNNLINYTAYTVTDYATTVPNFSGMATVSQTIKVTGSGVRGTITVLSTPEYDDAYRVKAITQRYNGAAPVKVAAYNYNELGQLTNKGLGVGSGSSSITLGTANSVGSTGVSAVTATTSIQIDSSFHVSYGGVFSARIAPAFLQQVDFRFNIRGQLTYINNSTLTGDSGHTEQSDNSVFGMQLLYNTTDSNLSNTAVYNGKLSAVKWMTKDGSGTNSTERAFKYSYDALDRYTKAAYAERTGSGSFTNTHGWDEAVTGYDDNGNIQHLNRKSASSPTASGSLIDSLTYTYDSNNANQLYSVTDATGVQTGFGIYAGGSSGGHYTYDPNGNLTADPYKNMTLTYNVLNRTDEISLLAVGGRKIDYIYDAGGSMIRKIATDTTGGAVTTTDYIGGFVYVNNVLSYFAMPEGRITNHGGHLTPEYVISDQQGNARITFNNTGTGNGAKVIQENSYYGFGMVMPGSLVGTPTPANKNLYNGGSELQNDFSNLPDYNQTFFRNYDAALGRWVGIDPEPESAESLTPYQYAGNNPIMGNDPMGNKVMDTQGSYIDPFNAAFLARWGQQQADRWNNFKAEGDAWMDAMRAVDDIMYNQQQGGGDTKPYDPTAVIGRLSVHVDAHGKTYFEYEHGEIEHDENGKFAGVNIIHTKIHLNNEENRMPEIAERTGRFAPYVGIYSESAEHITSAQKALGAAKTMEIVAKGTIVLSTISDLYLSTHKNPETGKYYQSWGLTALNGTVTFLANRIGGASGTGIAFYYEVGKLSYEAGEHFKTLPIQEQFNVVNTQMMSGSGGGWYKYQTRQK